MNAPILIVGDGRHIRLNLQLLLEASGYQADAAGDGEEAFAKCQSWRYNLALGDLQMPKMNGLELLCSLCEQYLEIAVAILTADGSVTRAVGAMKFSVVDFLFSQQGDQRTKNDADDWVRKALAGTTPLCYFSGSVHIVSVATRFPSRVAQEHY